MPVPVDKAEEPMNIENVSKPSSASPTPKPNPLKRKEPPTGVVEVADGPPASQAFSTSRPLAGCLVAQSPRPRPAAIEVASTAPSPKPRSSAGLPDADGEQDLEEEDDDGEGEDEIENENDIVVYDSTGKKEGCDAAGQRPPNDVPEEYSNGHIICSSCGLSVNIRDPESGDFTTSIWEAHQAKCCPPSTTSRRITPANGNGGPSMSIVFKPESKGAAAIIYTPESTVQSLTHPAPKRRRAKRTEEERIEYLRKDPYVAQFEAYRVLCASCNKWIRLRPNSTFCSIPWDAHRKSCLAKKISRTSKNAIAFEQRNELFSQDNDIRKFDPERLLCKKCDQWLSVSPDDHFEAIQQWLHHRESCPKGPIGVESAPTTVVRGVMNAHEARGQRPLSSTRTTKDIPRAPPPSGTQLAALTSVVNLLSATNGARSQPSHTLGSAREPANVGASDRPHGDGNVTGAGGRDVLRGPVSVIGSRERERERQSPFGPHENTARLVSGHPQHPQAPSHGHGLHPSTGSRHDSHPQHGQSSHGVHPQDRQRGPPPHHSRESQSQRPNSPSFHELTPSTYVPLHESRRRNAEQRADTLRKDHLIGEVEANRVFCRLCQKWVQLRQDSSFCAYPWLQHRAKCVARHQRRTEKLADIHTLNMSSGAATMLKRYQRPLSHPQLHIVDRHRGISITHSPQEVDFDMEHDELMSDSDEEGGIMDEDERITLHRIAARHPHSHVHSARHSQHHDHLPPHLVASSAPRGPGPAHVPPRPAGGQSGRLVSNGSGSSSFMARPDQQQGTNGPRMVAVPSRSNVYLSSTSAVDGSKKNWKIPPPPPPPGHPRYNPEAYAAYAATYGDPHTAELGTAGSCTHLVRNAQLQQVPAANGTARPRDTRDQDTGRVGSTSGKQGSRGVGEDEGNGDAGMEGDDPEAVAEGEPEVIDVDADDDAVKSSTSRRTVVKREAIDEDLCLDAEQSLAGRVPRGEREEVRDEDDDDEEGPDQSYDAPISSPELAALLRMPPSRPTSHHRPYSSGNGNEHASYTRYFGAGSLVNLSANVPPTRRGLAGPSIVSHSGAVSTSGVRRSHPIGLADLDSPAGRKQFVASSVHHLFSTTYEPSDELTVSTLLAYVNSAMPVDKHEDFDTAEIVRYLAQLKERGRVVFIGDLIRLGRD